VCTLLNYDMISIGLKRILRLKGQGHGGALPYKIDGGCSSYLLVVKKGVVVPLRVLSLKRSTAGAFAIPFRVLGRKNISGDNVLCKNLYLLGEKTN